MKIKYMIILILTLVGISFFAQADNSFVELQMKIQKTESGSKSYVYSWDSSHGVFRIDFNLEWSNYNESRHSRGYDLNNAQSAYMIFPDPSENCRFAEAQGVILGQADLNKNQLTLFFKGTQCHRMVDLLNTGTIVVHIYSVPQVNSSEVGAEVLRIQIWDHL